MTVKGWSGDNWESDDYIESWIALAKEKGQTFDPIEFLGKAGEEDYSWSLVYAFKNSNGTIALIDGAGGSCSSPDEFPPEFFPNLDQLLAHLDSRDKLESGWSRDSKFQELASKLRKLA